MDHRWQYRLRCTSCGGACAYVTPAYESDGLEPPLHDGAFGGDVYVGQVLSYGVCYDACVSFDPLLVVAPWRYTFDDHDAV